MRYRIPKATIPELAAIREQQIGRIMGNLRQLDKETAFAITITPAKDRRTLDQNNKFHAMCQELGDALGYTCEELKRLIKHELGFYTVVDGAVGKIARLDSSANWDTEKMSRAIEQLNLWAIDVGHVWRVES
jgi:hypothetical protein